MKNESVYLEREKTEYQMPSFNQFWNCFRQMYLEQLESPDSDQLDLIENIMLQLDLPTYFPDEEESVHHIYCDGAHKRGKKCLGIGIYFGPTSRLNLAQTFEMEKPTNQKAELLALYRTLEIIKEESLLPAVIHSDSMYSLKSVTLWTPNWIKNGWKNAKGQPVKNKEIIQPLYELYLELKDRVQLKFVRAHTGQRDIHSLGNHQADRLAQEAAQC